VTSAIERLRVEVSRGKTPANPPMPDVRFSTEKAAAIALALWRRYPCQAVPNGAWTDTAIEFVVSREYVRQIGMKLGMTGPGHGGGKRTGLPQRLCAGCGAEMIKRGTKAMCRDCSWVTLPCSNPKCGKPVKRLATRLAWEIGGRGNSEKYVAMRAKGLVNADGHDIRYTGRVFCDRKCFGGWMGLIVGRGAQRLRLPGEDRETWIRRMEARWE
jgi:hypothetical protein